jgi:hypothetical protein
MSKKDAAKANALNIFNQAVRDIETQLFSNQQINWSSLLAAKTALELVEKMAEEEACAKCKKRIDPSSEDYTVMMFSNALKYHHKTQAKEALSLSINGVEAVFCSLCEQPFLEMIKELH